MFLKYFYDQHLAQASYLLACPGTKEAVVIDPSRNIEGYLNVAKEQGFTIIGTLETHIHADFVSGSHEVAKRTGSIVYHSAEGSENGGYQFQKVEHKGLQHEDTVSVGNLTLTAVHTPGHTPEHLSYKLESGKESEPVGYFTGDFVFVGDVGRPDLLEKSVGVEDSARHGAKQMFQSIQQFKKAPDHLQIWPGHGAGSSCGKNLGAMPTTTVGYEKRTNPAFQYPDETKFVEFLLDGQPEPPAYFKKMKEMNVEEPPELGSLPNGKQMQFNDSTLSTIKKSMENGAIVIDTRPAKVYKQNHLFGTINLPYPGPFAEWMGRLSSSPSSIYLICTDQTFVELRDILFSIGMDHIDGWIDAKELEQRSLNAYSNITVEKLEDLRKNQDIQILDVRNQNEWENGHIPGAHHIPLSELPSRYNELNNKKPVYVHCASGVRSAIASSIITPHVRDVFNISGGYNEWNKSFGST